jgi:formate/nitrite transporter
MDKSYLTPAEIAESFIGLGHKKSTLTALKMFLLGILGGAFIAFAAVGSNTAIHTVESVGIAKFMAGTIFSGGLMMVVIAGAELFTGNCLITISCIERRSSWGGMLKNWLFVYVGNFAGAMLIVFLILQSGQLNMTGGSLGGFTIEIAVKKISMTFGNAFCMGILCNWLVCLAVWMAAGAKDIAGKVLAIFFPIWLFIASGFEHSVANMYYIPAGILAKANPAYVKAAISLGISQDKIDALNWSSFLSQNLLPVTLGNIAGGVVFVGLIYWISYLRKGKKLQGK